jgi:uncharacterized membrane protein
MEIFLIRWDFFMKASTLSLNLLAFWLEYWKKPTYVRFLSSHLIFGPSLHFPDETSDIIDASKFEDWRSDIP